MGDVPNFDMIINATSLGLNKHDEINLDFLKLEKINFFMILSITLKRPTFLKLEKIRKFN